MSTILSPEQLPPASAQFIAYGAPERAADPMGGEEPLTVRPQTYVRYYHDIVIKTLQEGGADGDKADLLTVNFDPQSVGLGKPIKAHMDSNEPIVPFLREAHAEQRPISVAIETQRKKRHSTEKAPISPLTPIHALRGADSPDGSGHHERMMGPSGAQTTNRLVMVNGRATKHLVSNPLEWASLVSNKAGDLPPAGWRAFAPGEDWKEYGAAVPSSTPAPGQSGASAQGGAPFDMDTLLSEVSKAVTAALEAHASDPDRPASSKFEGKPWEARTKDGRVNLGGYMPISEAYSYRWAARHLAKVANLAEDSEPESAEDVEAAVVTVGDSDPQEVWALVDLLMDLADRVQIGSYDAQIVNGQRTGTVDADRTFGSHKEARLWVQWVMDNQYPLVRTEDGSAVDDEIMSTWSDEVVQAAVDLMSETGRRAGQYLSSKSAKRRTDRSNEPKEATQPEGPSEAVVKALLGTLTRAWNNADAIRNLGSQVHERGMDNLLVSMSQGEDGTPLLAFPPRDGEPAGPLRSLLLHRWEEVASKGDDGPAPQAAHSQESPSTQSDEQASASEQSAPTQEAAQGTPQASANHGGYAPEVADIARAIRSAQGESNVASLKDVYYAAQRGNLLSASLSVQTSVDGSITIGRAGQDGYEVRTVQQVINFLRNRMTSPATQPDESSESNTASSDPTSNDSDQQVESAQPQEDDTPEGSNEQDEAEDSAEFAPDGMDEAETEGAETGESDPEGPSENADGEGGDEPPAQDAEGVSEAQKIADSVDRHTSTAAEVQAMIDKAKEMGVAQEMVEVGRNKGRLRIYLDSILKAAQKREGRPGTSK